MINAIVSDLVEKRLWPVAAILVVLIVGVPMTLAKPGEAPPPEPMPAAETSNDGGPQLALSRTATTGFARAPRVNKTSLDPFADRTEKQTDAIVNEVKSQIEGALGGGGSTGTISPGDGSLPGISPNPPKGTDGGGGGGDTKPTTPKTEKDDVLSVLITVNNGEPTQLDDVRTLSPLPDAENPFLVYVGKTSTGAASFLVSSEVTPTGGTGSCDPSPQDCRTLTMGAGDTEMFKLTDGSTVEITVIGVDTKNVPVTGTAARAARLEARARKVGAAALKSVLDDDAVMYALGRQKVKFRF